MNRNALIRAAPDRFSTTPHYDGHPSVLVGLAAVGEVELPELVDEASRPGNRGACWNNAPVLDL